MGIRIAKVPNSQVIEIGNAATLNTPQQPNPMVLRAFVVQIMLQVVVDDLAVGLRQPSLIAVVAVTEIMPIAAGQEIETARVVR